MNKLYDQGAEVVDISGSSAKTHALFKGAYKLTYTPIADEIWNVFIEHQKRNDRAAGS